MLMYLQLRFQNTYLRAQKAYLRIRLFWLRYLSGGKH